MKLLDRYIELAALRSIFLVAAGLTALFSLLEFVDQLRDVGQGQYGVANALVYVLLTVPSRLLQLAPVSMLLGSLFALGNLANDSELIAMQAVGLSERQIAGWVLKLAVPIMLALLLVAEFVIPTAQRMAQAERMSSMAGSVSAENANGFWAQGDHQYLNVRWVDHADVLQDIDIYEFGDNGALKRFIHADRARIVSDETWRLEAVERTLVEEGHAQTETLDSLDWPAFLHPRQVRLLILPPDSMPPVELFLYVHELKRSNRQVARLEQALWSKLSLPLSMAAMVVMATPFVFGTTRARSAGQRIAIGAGIGIVFSLTQQITSLVGLLLNLSPALAATAPSLILLAATRTLSAGRRPRPKPHPSYG